GDVVDVLLAQHKQVKHAMEELSTLTRAQKAEAFEQLAQLLERHERGEQQVVRPVTQRQADEGDQIAEERLTEERNADEALAELRDIGVDDPPLIRILLSFEMRCSCMP